MTVNEALFVCFPDLSVKYAVGISLFTNTLLTLGTERHRHIYQAVWERKVLEEPENCFCLFDKTKFVDSFLFGLD